MAKCVNCPNEADHHVADPGVNPLDFCDRCLPTHWRGRAQAGHFRPATPVVGKSEEPTPVVEKAPRRRR